MSDNQVCEVSLIGGEPFNHEGLMEILEYCQSRDMAINLVTNATLIDEERIKRLAEINRLVVIVSLDVYYSSTFWTRGGSKFKLQ